MLVASWIGMQAVHELGHVLAASATGGTVQRVVLHPLTISRTDVSPNPSPLAVAWAGPLVGVILPLLCRRRGKVDSILRSSLRRFLLRLLPHRQWRVHRPWVVPSRWRRRRAAPTRCATWASHRFRRRQLRRWLVDLASHKRRIRLWPKAALHRRRRSTLGGGRGCGHYRACDDLRPTLSNVLAVANTSSSIVSVSRPVFVFCRLGW